MVSKLDSMLESRLRLWKTQGKHTAFPENILIYRDGDSKGQYEAVLNTDLPFLRKACVNLYPPPDQKKDFPKITIVIVGKRHHTRFYPTETKEADPRTSNNSIGTVVDRGITEARNWDFFLQSHTALHGTAWPAHYYVIHNEIFRKRTDMYTLANTADDLEGLTHSMCYLFGRATKAVSICPPAYYADLVCERARRYLSRYFDMHTPSTTPSQSEAGERNLPKPCAKDIEIHQDLCNTIFYI
jgi:eukaryotic translation initiation factor 2C